jgi:hypothetical protein
MLTIPFLMTAYIKAASNESMALCGFIFREISGMAGVCYLVCVL